MMVLETSSALRPNWYFSGIQMERDVANNNNINADAAAVTYSVKRYKKMQGKVPSYDGASDTISSNTTDGVKCERLSPYLKSDVSVSTHGTPSPSISPKSPITPYGSSSPSVSPMSPASHLPVINTPTNFFTPSKDKINAYDHFSHLGQSSEIVLQGGRGDINSAFTPGGPGAINQLEALINRNCSDIMRSMASKYNNIPNDYLGSQKNGVFHHPLGLTGFRQGSTPVSVPTLSTKYLPVNYTDKKVEAPVVVAPLPPNPLVTPMLSAALVPQGIPGFPVLDVSSSHAILNMVRSASVTQQTQLENYLRGAMKRPAETPPTSPLDLSATVAPKRSRTEPSRSFDVNSLFGIQDEGDMKTDTKITTPNSPPPDTNTTTYKSPSPQMQLRTPSPGIPTSPVSPCLDKQCPTFDVVNNWTVDDVCSFVGSIELCAEYVEAFREQRIDGSALPLLTEEHLTSSINMKLGPALKLRSVLARRLGACNVCLHCDHCEDRR